MFKTKKLLSAMAVAAILSATPLAGAQAAQSTGSQGPVYIPPAELALDLSNSSYNNSGWNDHYYYDDYYGGYGGYGGYGSQYNTSNYEHSYGGMYADQNAFGTYDVYDPKTGMTGTMTQSDIMSNFSSSGGFQDIDYSSFLADATSAGSLNTDYFSALSSTATPGTTGSSGSYLSDAASSLWGSYGASGQDAVTKQATSALTSYLGSNSTLGGLLGSADDESDLSFGVSTNRVVTDVAESMFPSESFVSSLGSLSTIGGLDSLSGFYDSFANTSFASALGLSGTLGDGANKLGEAAVDGMGDLMGSLGDSFGDFSLSDFSMGDFDLGSFDLGSLDFASFDMGGITDGLGDMLGGFDIGGFDLGSLDMSSITDSISGALGDTISGMLGDFLGGFDMGSIVSGIGSFFG
tara:strand:+ start:277518 stop:278738 length:1221 start_codon:yes stop_codon:yes gene_type:complete